MDYKIASVSLDQIETDDCTFKITTNTERTELALSISAIGLLQPPILAKKKSGFVVVCGFRRIAVCRALTIPSIPARILPSGLPAISCAQMAISDNSLQRPLNIVEQSRAYALVRRFSREPSTWQEMLEPTGLAGSRTAMDRIMPVAAMPLSMQDAILEGSIALPIALHINQLNEEDANSMCYLFRTLTTGLNVQRELVELISEISLRDDISIVQLIKQKDISDIMENPDFSAPQKVRELRMVLKGRRYPALSKAEALYSQNLKSIKLDQRVQLTPPRFFEGKTYRLSLAVDSRQQLRALQPELEKLIQHPHLLPD